MARKSKAHQGSEVMSEFAREAGVLGTRVSQAARKVAAAIGLTDAGPQRKGGSTSSKRSTTKRATAKKTGAKRTAKRTAAKKTSTPRKLATTARKSVRSAAKKTVTGAKRAVRSAAKKVGATKKTARKRTR